MRQHSIESKLKVPQRYSSPPEERLQTAKDFFRDKNQHRLVLRRCDSASSLARRSNHELSHLQQKYRMLEKDYLRVVETFKGKKNCFNLQTKEIERLKQQTIKETRQIQRLKKMLKLTQKKDIGLQTQGEIDLNTYRKRIELSNGQSDLTSETRCEEVPTIGRKSSKLKKAAHDPRSSKVKLSKISRYSVINNQQEYQRDGELINRRYKLIPTLEFKRM